MKEVNNIVILIYLLLILLSLQSQSSKDSTLHPKGSLQREIQQMPNMDAIWDISNPHEQSLYIKNKDHNGSNHVPPRQYSPHSALLSLELSLCSDVPVIHPSIQDLRERSTYVVHYYESVPHCTWLTISLARASDSTIWWHSFRRLVVYSDSLSSSSSSSCLYICSRSSCCISVFVNLESPLVFASHILDVVLTQQGCT